MPDRSLRLALTATLAGTLLLSACQPPGSTPGTNAPVAVPVSNWQGPSAWRAPQKATISELRVETRGSAEGYTMADLDRDEDASDDFEPKLDVVFRAEGYGEDATEPNATIKVRGHSTRLTRQKSYTVKLNKGAAPYAGGRTLFLNKHPYDISRVRNKLSFDLFAFLPELPSLNTRFVRLFVDDKDYGLFTQVEAADEDFLAAHGLDPAGWLYKAEYFEFLRYADQLRTTDDAAYKKKAFETILEIKGENKDHAPLLAMLDAVNDETRPIDAVVAEHFDRDNYLSWLAVNILTANDDTNSQNFLLYRASAGGPWRFVPWDYDGAWDYYGQPKEKTRTRPRWTQGVSNWWGVRLHRRFLEQPHNVQALRERVDALASTLFTADHIQQLIDSYRDTVRLPVLSPPDLDGLPAAGDKPVSYDGELARLPGTVEINRARFIEALDRPMPVFLGDPESGEGGRVFNWDASFDLQGDALRYDFQLARSPRFEPEALVVDRPGLSETRTTVSEPLAPGTYYFRVTIRDAAGHWQVPFDSHSDASGERFDGLRAFTID